MTTKWKTRDLTLIAMFAVVIALCSWISIPMVIPVTMQTFAVFLAVGVLGGRRGTMAVAVYLLMGLVGLPVFSGFSGVSVSSAVRRGAISWDFSCRRW